MQALDAKGKAVSLEALRDLNQQAVRSRMQRNLEGRA
jgi:hypothetical protein